MVKNEYGKPLRKLILSERGKKDKLERYVCAWFNSQARPYPERGIEKVWENFSQGGCRSGIVSTLTSPPDIAKFYKRFKNEINYLLVCEMSDQQITLLSDMFGEEWDQADPLAMGYQNQKVLSWFGFEEMARVLMSLHSIRADSWPTHDRALIGEKANE